MILLGLARYEHALAPAPATRNPAHPAGQLAISGWVRFRGTGVMADGTRYTSTIVLAFNGTTEYFVNCQYTAAKAAGVMRACDQVVGSFHVGKASAAQGNTQPPQAQAGAQAEQQAPIRWLTAWRPAHAPAMGQAIRPRRSVI